MLSRGEKIIRNKAVRKYVEGEIKEYLVKKYNTNYCGYYTNCYTKSDSIKYLVDNNGLFGYDSKYDFDIVATDIKNKVREVLDKNNIIYKGVKFLKSGNYRFSYCSLIISFDK